MAALMLVLVLTIVVIVLVVIAVRGKGWRDSANLLVKFTRNIIHVILSPSLPSSMSSCGRACERRGLPPCNGSITGNTRWPCWPREVAREPERPCAVGSFGEASPNTEVVVVRMRVMTSGNESQQGVRVSSWTNSDQLVGTTRMYMIPDHTAGGVAYDANCLQVSSPAHVLVGLE